MSLSSIPRKTRPCCRRRSTLSFFRKAGAVIFNTSSTIELQVMNKNIQRDNMQSPLNDRALRACLLKPSCLLAVLCGAALMLAIVRLPASSSQPPHHVYELRLYHVNEGKIDTLKARFGNHTDAIFRRHNMKSIGYWSP